MAKDSSAKINGSENETSDDSLRLFSAYDAVCHAEEQLDSIEKTYLDDGIFQSFEFTDGAPFGIKEE